MPDSLSALLLHLAEPLLDPGSRTFWPGLVVAALLAAVIAWWSARSDPRRAMRRALRAALPWRLLTHRSSRLDLQLLAGRQLLAWLGAIPAVASAWWIAFRLVGWLDASVGAPEPWSGSLWLPSLAYAVTLFVAWDLSRYVLHRLMHEVPALWAFHQVHHSAEVLTPLTFHRVHPVESILYGLRGALVTGLVTGAFFWAFRGAASDVTVLGVSALGLVGNTLTGNLRHSHVWLRFPAAAERWLLSPAQHQLHHAEDSAWYGRNYGTWIAVWDRLGGTLAIAPATAPARFGVADRNHGDHLLSAWFGPFLALGRRALPGAAAAAAILVSATARAEPDGAAEPAAPDAPSAGSSGDTPPPDNVPSARDPGYSMVVYGDDGTPRRVAGSAHVVDEAELARFRRTDIHDALTAVPGVYVRTEDGFGLRPNIGMRGANSDRSSKVTLLEDGVLLGPAPYAAPAAYYFPMTARLVGIEVFKGPASTQHGPQTVGGAINVLTRAVPQDGADARIDLGIGERSTSRLHAWAGAGNARRGFLIEGSSLGTAGFKELDGGGPTGFVRGDLMLKGRLATDPELSTRHALELKLGYGGEDARETYLGLHPDDFSQAPNRRYAASALDRMRWDRTQAELSWTARVGERLQVRTVAYHHHLQRTWLRLSRFSGGPELHGLLSRPAGGQGAVYLDILRGAEDAVTDDQLLMLANNDRRFHSGGVQSVARLRSDLGPTQSTLEVGLRVHADHVRRYHTELAHRMTSGALVAEDRPPILTTDSIADVLAISAHVHETLEARTWALTPGLRVEAIRARLQAVDGPKADATTRIVALPGLGGSARLGPRVHAFAGIYRGFSPVAPGEPDDVRPESSWNTEAGLRAGPLDAPILELVGFVNDYANLTGQCTFSGGCTGDDIDRQFNGGKALIYGLEAASHGRLPLPAGFALAIDATYTWTEARFRTGFVSGFPQFGNVEPGFGLPYVPAHQGALSASAGRDGYELAARAVARSGMRDVASAGPLDPDRDVPALATLDLSAHAPLTRHVAAWATATNLTNAQPASAWRPFGARPIAPRLVMVGVTLAARPGGAG